MHESLDQRYPFLSGLIRSVHGISLEELAGRAPTAVEYEYYDLERLLANVRDNDHWHEASGLLIAYFDQPRGYLATLEAYVGLGIVKDPRRFVTKKLAVPAVPRPEPSSSEMLDTLSECSWALWLLEKYGNVEEEKKLPSGIGDADFYVRSADGPLWIDSVSVATTTDQPDLSAYLSKVVRTKWHNKFGDNEHDRALGAVVAVSIIKRQEHVLSWVQHYQATGQSFAPESSIWSDCPGLRQAWFGLPPWHDSAHKPEIFAVWQRP